MARSILVVEDNQDNMMLISDILLSLDYAVLQAVDGEQGVHMAQSQKPDLILMDLSLPRVDGWTATRRIKADAALKNIPVIALTAHAMIGDRERALEAGCDDYMSKPIVIRELVAKLTRYLESGRGEERESSDRG
jgi:CheY-like chemotaxis protein